MRTIETIKDGYTCSAAALADGWLACVLVLENVDEHFIERPEGGPPALRAGKTEGDWMAAVAGLKREVVAVRCRAGAVQTQPLSQADRIAGTAAAGGAQPALAWCGRHGELWRLMLWRDGAARPLAEREGPLARPACAWINGRLLIAYEVAAADADQVEVRDGDGERLSAVEGRRPHLASTADGSGVLVVERVESRDAVRLHAFEATNGGLGAEIPLPSSNDYNFNAHLAYEAADGTLYVVHESCPTWGIDHRVGRHREIRLWALPRGAAGFQPAPGT